MPSLELSTRDLQVTADIDCRLKIAYSSASIPKAKAWQSTRQARRDVRWISTTAAFEGLVFERRRNHEQETVT
jgi:hypothetical protein